MSGLGYLAMRKLSSGIEFDVIALDHQHRFNVWRYSIGLYFFFILFFLIVFVFFFFLSFRFFFFC